MDGIGDEPGRLRHDHHGAVAVSDERRITFRVGFSKSLPPDQREYLIACRLVEIGVPIDPLTQHVRHGELTYTTDPEGYRHYVWRGKDLRS